MTEEIEFILESTEESMQGSIAHLEKEFLIIFHTLKKKLIICRIMRTKNSEYANKQSYQATIDNII